MKIKINRSVLVEALKKVQNIVASKVPLQILENVLLEADGDTLSLTTSDLDISIKAVAKCVTDVSGKTTLPAKVLFNTVAKLAEGPVDIDVDQEDHAVISAGSAIIKLTGMNHNDFPALPSTSSSFAYRLPQNVLKEMLRKTAYAASQDETRRSLRGVLMSFKEGKLTMVATDGRRLALIEHEVEFPADAEKDIVLPTKVVAELQRSLGADGDVIITNENTQVSFNLGDTQIYSKLLDEVYPDFRRVIPNSFEQCVTVERKPLLDALDRTSAVNSGKDVNSTLLVFDDNQLIVSTNAKERGEARDIVPIKYNGPRIEIVFNPGYVMEPLKAIDDDDIYVNMNNGSTPAIIKCSIPFLYLMMPLRVS